MAGQNRGGCPANTDIPHQKRAPRFHLLGHSMGGMIVQQLATMVPVRINRLTLYGTVGHGASCLIGSRPLIPPVRAFLPTVCLTKRGSSPPRGTKRQAILFAHNLAKWLTKSPLGVLCAMKTWDGNAGFISHHLKDAGELGPFRQILRMVPTRSSLAWYPEH